MSNKKNIIILGCTGMLGNTIIRYLDIYSEHNVFGLCRKNNNKLKLNKVQIIENIDLDDLDRLKDIIFSLNANIIVNCIGVIKQKKYEVLDSDMIRINSLFPHVLNEFCNNKNIFLIHFSTDCVFSGTKGNYSEKDIPDPIDLYGRSKLVGELNGQNTITLRTSIIGHELNTNKSLLNWFLSSQNEIKGYKNAFFSGLTTLEVAKTLEKYIFPNPKLSGLYHLASDRISKYDLLNIISKIYNHEINISEDYDYYIDRSLNCDKLINDTGYEITSWSEQIKEMYKFK